MKGLELARRFYETYGAPMLHEQFPAYEEILAVGLVGSGSECLGFDDAVSQDHDFEPGFCIFLPDEEVVDRRTAFLLERAYSKLPKEFEGFRRSALNPVGGNRHGVLRMDEFFLAKTGSPDGRLTTAQWLSLPEFYLAEAVGGEVFRDDCGAFSAIRARLAAMPEDIRRKKLAGELLRMAQSGQYNYCRCLQHGETGAAQLAVGEFVGAAIHAAFLLNRRYLPFYKWQFRALRALPLLASAAQPLEFLLTTENTGDLAATKADIIEDLCGMFIEELQKQSLTKAVCGNMEKHAYSVNDGVADAELRNAHILAAIG